MLFIFSYVYYNLISCFVMCLFNSFAYFYQFNVLFFFYKCWIWVPYQIYLLLIFSSTFWFVFIMYLMVNIVFKRSENFIFDEGQFINLFFVMCFLLLMKSLPILKYQTFFYIFFYFLKKVLTYMFSPIIHFNFCLCVRM